MVVMLFGTYQSLVNKVGFYTLTTVRFVLVIWIRQVLSEISRGQGALAGNRFKEALFVNQMAALGPFFFALINRCKDETHTV
jgi:hypothetical protein